jgi:hypothetical protein
MTVAWFRCRRWSWEVFPPARFALKEKAGAWEVGRLAGVNLGAFGVRVSWGMRPDGGRMRGSV